ncbi:MAG: Rid family hydrolase [Betaproteobacteria bacterium]|nr:Rid family hydrolase [Betaproteobacteria bacterium]
MSGNSGIAYKSFHGATGGSEHFVSVDAPHTLGLEEQVRLVQARYAEAREALGLAPETAMFRRIFLSDAVNQVPMLCETDLVRDAADNPVAVSIVQQQPLPASKIALLAYHVEGPDRPVKQRLSPRHVLVSKNGSRHLWSTRLCEGARDLSTNAAGQTRNIFNDLIGTITAQGGRLADHCVRTWIYMKGVDVFYQDMVDSRRALFDRHGLTRDTFYISSTGIEGACAHPFDVVSMDAYSNLDLAPGQRSFLNDFSRLCPTKDYNVTFERGTRIAYADRAHHFISGTASIDARGEVLHVGNVLRQLDRAVENVDALLRSGNACFDDMQHLIVYLRDPADFHAVEGYLRERYPDLPAVIVQAAVCRPEWLVEIEGMAVTANDEPALPTF